MYVFDSTSVFHPLLTSIISSKTSGSTSFVHLLLFFQEFSESYFGCILNSRDWLWYNSLWSMLCFGHGMVAMADLCQEYSTQINNNKCNKTSCLNAFYTSFMPTLSYRMIATQFTEQQWKKYMCPAIWATCNAAGMVKNFTHANLLDPLEYQSIGVKILLPTRNQSHHCLLWMKLPATPLLVNYYNLMRNSSALKWVFLFFSPPSPTMRKRMLPIYLPDETRICGDSWPILFSNWRLRRFMKIS